MVTRIAFSSYEWRVVWRWVESSGRDKVRIYKTEKGARAFFAKLTSKNGRFALLTDDERVLTYRLEFARLETREVWPWDSLEEWKP